MNWRTWRRISSGLMGTIPPPLLPGQHRVDTLGVTGQVSYRNDETVVQKILRPLRTQWVCEVTGVTRQTVSNWRRGRDEPQMQRWNKLLDALVESFPEAER